MVGQTVAVTIALGDLPTWLTAGATAAAWLAALTSIRNERRARLETERQAVEREERAQALTVSAWYGAKPDDQSGDALIILNRSETPVYNVVVTMVFVQGAAPRRGEEYRELDHLRDHRHCLATLPPGLWTVPAPEGWAGMMRFPAAEIAFSDAAGLHWVRRSNGELVRLEVEPFEHFAIERPIGYAWPNLVRS